MIQNSDELFFTKSDTLEDIPLSNQFSEHMEFVLVKNKITATKNDIYFALSLSIKDRLVRRWLRTQYVYMAKDVKRVYYLSLEFLMGRLLTNALINMNYYDECRDILKKDGYNLTEVIEEEPDMALGNGGLGRLAACFLDSMATLKLPAFGYGIRYEFGIFKQQIENGEQVEQPDNWLSYGNPWEIQRRELVYRVKFFGKISTKADEYGHIKFNWVDTEDVLAVAYDVPVPGFHNDTVNNLRLWAAKATNEFSFKEFNDGNYVAAVERKNISENISKVLYPNDTYTEGKFLRLKQQFFFVTASLQDIIRKYKVTHNTFSEFPNKIAIQLNDTHPVIAIPELMRILIDEEEISWEDAWDITRNTFAYTNHTIVPEALEEWAVSIMDNLLPRHLQIIYEINRRFVNELKERYTKDESVLARLSIIKEGAERKVRMAHLAIVACHSVNGVAALHTEILKNIIFKDFNKIYPGKIKNVTNGITIRRWLLACNPHLAELITDKIGERWITHAEELRDLEKFANNDAFLETLGGIKWANKRRLADYIETNLGVTINPESMFDVQIKRFHEYKRQLLNVLHVIALYNRIKANPNGNFTPRTVIFAGKAAPAYVMAKNIIKLINGIAKVVNNDPEVGDLLKVVFIPNYGVTLAELIIPACDLSEQISTAGYEASGTGNMKFAINGALTIGTMDGANVEMREEVKDDNIFIFGMLSDEVIKLKTQGYNPLQYLKQSTELQKVIEVISSNYFSASEPGAFKGIVDNLLHQDYYCLFADFESYVRKQDEVSAAYADKKLWNKMALMNVARMGKFSSDRSIREYAQNIWNVKPIDVEI